MTVYTIYTASKYRMKIELISSHLTAKQRHHELQQRERAKFDSEMIYYFVNGKWVEDMKVLTEIEVFYEAFFNNSGFNYIPVVIIHTFHYNPSVIEINYMVFIPKILTWQNMTLHSCPDLTEYFLGSFLSDNIESITVIARKLINTTIKFPDWRFLIKRFLIVLEFLKIRRTSKFVLKIVGKCNRFLL